MAEKQIIGGGSKKVLYTLKTVSRIGLGNSAKALTAKNTCKACGLGMGGQHGGMTNELGEFPSVCNKSVQAQSTDIQPPIPSEIFQHSLDELRELTPHELEHLGRLGKPLLKLADGQRFEEMDWSKAMAHLVDRFGRVQPSRAFFYSSGRSSNEAGFLLQLLARCWGTNNVNNCSYYCHQATSVGLGQTIGSGTSTVELDDLSGCDLIFVIGANPSSNHPRFIHKLIACRERGGDVIVINPAKEPGLVKFAAPKSARSMISGGSEIASLYVQPNIGGDIALFKGIAKALIEHDGLDEAFIASYTDGWEAFEADITATDWGDIQRCSGVARSEIEALAKRYATADAVVFAWGMGMTHHRFGCENVEYIANLAMLRGMVGKKYAGLLPLRGHSNVQGIGTIGVKPVLPQQVFDNLEREMGVTLPDKEGLDTLGALDAAHTGAIDAALIMGGNLYAATPNSQWASEALDAIPFKVFLTTTLNQGHLRGIDNSEALILPVLARDEEPQATTQESMFNFVRLSDGGINRIATARSEVSLLAELGAGLLADCPVDFSEFANHKRIREAIAKTVPGMEELKDIDFAKREFHVKGRLLHRREFFTQDGRAHFQVHPIPDPARQNDSYPFRLASVRSEGQFNSIIYEETDSYRNNATRWSVFMSPQDMAAENINKGDRVDVFSPDGEMRAVDVIPFDIPPGNLLAYYPEANRLTSTAGDPRSKTPAFKSIAVRIRRT